MFKITLSSRILVRNSLINFVGLAVPLVAAAICVPRLIAILGNERFAILSIAYVLIGYFTLLDLGIGRAVTQRLAQEAVRSPEDDATPAQLIWTALTVMFGLGALAGIIFIAITPFLIRDILRVESQYVSDCTRALQILSVSLPFVVSSSGWRGVFEAYQRFTFISVVRGLMGIGTFAGALVALQISPTISIVVGTLVAIRIAGWAAQAVVCLRFCAPLRTKYAFVTSHVLPLFKSGGWIAVNGVFGSVSLWIDRFLIATLISTAAVTYYVTPFDAVTKLSLITGAVSNVFFSAFAAQHARSRQQTTTLYRRCVALSALLLLPFSIVIILFAQSGLALWVNPSFADQSYRVAQIITVGTYCLCIQSIPWSLLQGTGRAAIPAVFDVVALALYLPAVWFLTLRFGLVGAAIAWAGRSALSTMALFIAAEWHLESNRTSMMRGAIASVILAALFVIAGFTSLTLPMELGFVTLVSSVCAVWFAGSLRRFIRPDSSLGLSETELEVVQ